MYEILQSVIYGLGCYLAGIILGAFIIGTSWFAFIVCRYIIWGDQYD